MNSIHVTASRPAASAATRALFQPTAERRRAAFAALPRDDRHGDDPHAADVAWLAGRLCVELGVPDALARRVVGGARSHDVGKAFVPRELLERPGPLNAAEREEIKLHAARGAAQLERRALRQGLDLSIEISVALHHHERWDGLGYPHGLTGAEIPLAARIVAVADVYDALVTARAYKAAWPRESAIEIVREGRGTHFDPACADAMISLSRGLSEGWKRSAQRAHERARAVQAW